MAATDEKEVDPSSVDTEQSAQSSDPDPSDGHEDQPSARAKYVSPVQKLEGWRLLFVEIWFVFSAMGYSSIQANSQNSLGLSMMLSTLDSSIVSTALVTIGSYFHEFITVSSTLDVFLELI